MSANPYLEGVSRASHWRFAGRLNADGAVREAGGRTLERAAARLSAAIGRPLKVGTAVASDAGRSLQARWVVHCIAPDALVPPEDAYTAPGMYHMDCAAYEEHAAALLQRTIAAAIATASATGARSLALPAIGCGIRGFDPESAGAAAFSAAAQWLRDGNTTSSSRLRRIDFVVYSDAVWARWPAAAEYYLGSPDPGETRGADMHSWSWIRGMPVYKQATARASLLER